MLMFIKLLPVMACLFMQASCHCDCQGNLEEHYRKVNATLQQLQDKIENLIEIVSGPEPQPMDCEEVREKSQEATIESGLYLVQAPGLLKRRIYCNFTEQETWTTISRRINEEDIFNRTWDEYKNGFGKASGDYWIGNEMLYQLTTFKKYYLRITMKASLRGQKTSLYGSFKVLSENDDYRLMLGPYDSTNSDGGDSFFPNDECNRNGHTDAPFSTYDHGNAINCSKTLSGGWWFTDCGCSNLNGKYVRGGHVSKKGSNIGIYWDKLYFDRWGSKSSLRSVIMEIRELVPVVN